MSARPDRATGGSRADTRIFLLLHRAIRCDLERLVAALDELSDGDVRRVRGLARWYGELARQIHGHHRAEDEVFFRQLAARSEELAAGAGPQMADDHRYVASLTDRVAERLRRLATSGDSWPVARRAARADAAALAALADDHFTHEEREVVPLFARHFTAAEYEAMSRHADRVHSLGEMCFALPWFFDHLQPDEREDVLADTPAVLRLLAAAFGPRYRRIVRAAGLDHGGRASVQQHGPGARKRMPQ
jgi:hemerythrin-like domain-containing protein